MPHNAASTRRNYRLRNRMVLVIATVVSVLGPSSASAVISTNGHDCVETSAGSGQPLMPQDVRSVVTDIREKTGVTSIKVGEKAELEFDETERPEKGSSNMRREILSAIRDFSIFFILCDRSHSEDLHFAEISGGESRVVVDEIGGEFQEGRRITIYVISLDFGDYENSAKLSPDEVLVSHSVSLSIFHEINHKVSYDPGNPIPKGGIRPDKSRKGVPGVIENTNRVRRELGLMERRTNQHNGKKYNGRISRYKYCFEIEFSTAEGAVRYLRWQMEKYRSETPGSGSDSSESRSIRKVSEPNGVYHLESGT